MQLRYMIFNILLMTLIFIHANYVHADDDNIKKDKILAIIDGITINQRYFDIIAETIPPQFKVQLATPEGKRHLLEQIITTRLFSGQARELKLDKQQGVLNKIQIMKDQILAGEYIDHIQKSIRITEQELKNYYKKNEKIMMQSEQIRARHILVKTRDTASKILEELKKGGDFSKLAKEKSAGPSKTSGGDLGWFGKGRMTAKFEKAAFQLKKGEISNIVKTKFGYHIIRVDDRKETRVKTFEEVKTMIEKRLKQEKSRKKIESLRQQLKKDKNVKIIEEN